MRLASCGLSMPITGLAYDRRIARLCMDLLACEKKPMAKLLACARMLPERKRRQGIDAKRARGHMRPRAAIGAKPVMAPARNIPRVGRDRVRQRPMRRVQRPARLRGSGAEVLRLSIARGAKAIPRPSSG